MTATPDIVGQVVDHLAHTVRWAKDALVRHGVPDDPRLSVLVSQLYLALQQSADGLIAIAAAPAEPFTDDAYRDAIRRAMRRVEARVNDPAEAGPPGLPIPWRSPMNDRADSTPVQWPVDEAGSFRSTFLLHFTDPRDREAMLRVGGLLYQMVLEFSSHWPESSEPWLHHELRAAAADLRHVAAFLKDIGENVVETDPPIVAAAEEIGTRVNSVADDLAHLITLGS